jgi:hypothetical protein
MQEHSSWSPRKPTRVRRVLDRLKRLRYRVHYWKVLRELRRLNPEITRFTLTAAEKKRIKDYWAGLGIRSINLDWYRLFGATLGAVDERMVPEELFRVEFEHLLNDERMAAANSDKLMLARNFPDINQPVTVLRNIHGCYFDGSYVSVDRGAAWDLLRSRTGCFLVKPAAGSGGAFNIHRIEVDHGNVFENGRPLSQDFIERGLGGCNFLIQQFVSQHPAFAAFHPQSLNTCRIITVKMKDVCQVVCATFRMGRGNYVDNGHAGGLLCGVSTSGRLTPFAFDRQLRRYEEHPITGLAFKDQQLPHFDRLCTLAIAVHQRLLYHNIASFDMALDANSAACMIEVNLFGQGITLHQLLRGGPVFGDYTRQIFELAANRREELWQ